MSTHARMISAFVQGMGQPALQYPRLDMPTDIFARLGDIKGESLDFKHKDEIEVLSYSWGVTAAGSVPPGGGGGAGKATFQDLSIVHNVDKASPKLMEACATGTRLKDATITHRKAGKNPLEFLIVKMNDVIITGVIHGGTTTAPLSETVTMTFAKVDFAYSPQKPNGTLDEPVRLKYDLKNNKVG